MSELGDLLADGIAKNDPDMAVKMGIKPMASIGEPTEAELAAKKAQMEQNEKINYCQTVLRIAERYYTGLPGEQSAKRSIQAAREFVDAAQEWVETVMKPKLEVVKSEIRDIEPPPVVA